MLEGSLSHLLPLRMSELWHQRNHISPQPLPAQVSPGPTKSPGAHGQAGESPVRRCHLKSGRETLSCLSGHTGSMGSCSPPPTDSPAVCVWGGGGRGDTARAEGQGELWGQTRSSSPVPALVLELYKLPVLLPGNPPLSVESGCLDLFCMLSGETGDHWTSGQGQSHKNHKAVASNARPSASCSSWVPWGALQNSLRIHGLSHPMSSARRTWMGKLGRGWQPCPDYALC